MGPEQCGEEDMEFIGGAIDVTPHPEAVGDIYLVPVVTGFLKAIGIGAKRFLQEIARIFFGIQEIKISCLHSFQARRLSHEVLVRDKKPARSASQMFVVHRLQFHA
jgi:hypothetical protein